MGWGWAAAKAQAPAPAQPRGWSPGSTSRHALTGAQRGAPPPPSHALPALHAHTLARDGFEHIVESAGDDAPQLGRLILALHGEGLASAGLPIRKDGTCEDCERRDGAGRRQVVGIWQQLAAAVSRRAGLCIGDDTATAALHVRPLHAPGHTHQPRALDPPSPHPLAPPPAPTIVTIQHCVDDGARCNVKDVLLSRVAVVHLPCAEVKQRRRGQQQPQGRGSMGVAAWARGAHALPAAGACPRPPRTHECLSATETWRAATGCDPYPPANRPGQR